MPRNISDLIDKQVGGRMRMRRLMLHMSQTEIAGALATDVPVGPEMREGHQPRQRQPPVALVPDPSGASFVVFEGLPALPALRDQDQFEASSPV
jgi:hypothetical protein